MKSESESLKQEAAGALADASAIAAQLSRAGSEERGAVFYDALKSTDFPSLAIRMAGEPARLYRSAFDCLYTLGQASLPLAVGLTMHQYVTAALATFPTTDVTLRNRWRDLAQRFVTHRLLSAASSVDVVVASDGSVQSSVIATVKDGRFIVTGSKRYNSLVSYADVLFFTATVEGRGFGLFAAPIRNNPRVRLGPCLAPGFMTASDTRSLSFDAFEVEESHALSIGEGTDHKHAYSLAWFHALAAAPYLGAASEALRICALAEAGNARKGQACGSSELGRLSLQLSEAIQLTHGVQWALSRLHTEPDEAIASFGRAAQVMKYFGSKLAVEIVMQARERVGIRGLLESEKLGEISNEIGFGPLHPRANSWIEGSFAANLLSKVTTSSARCEI